MHPEVVALAQQELDEVLGGERLPDFSDKPQLPYVSALLKEVLRWGFTNPLGTSLLYFPHTSRPKRLTLIFLGTPHQLREDDVYEGWFIPAGATIFYNLWYAIQPCVAFPTSC